MQIAVFQQLVLFFNRLWGVLLAWLIGSVIGGMMILNTDWASLFWDEKEFLTVQGRLIAKEDASFSINEKSILAYRYVFELGQQQYEGLSYSMDSPADLSDFVNIRYMPSDPRVSYIAGMRREQVPLGMGIVFLFVVVLPVQVWLGYSIWEVYRDIQVLKKGALTKAGLVDSKMAYQLLEDEGPPGVYRLIFHYTVEGKLYETKISTRDPASLHDQEWLFYNPNRPKRTVFFSALPAALQAKVKAEILPDSDRQIDPQSLDPRLFHLLNHYPDLTFQEDESQLWAGNALPGLRWSDFIRSWKMVVVGLGWMALMIFIVVKFWPFKVLGGAYILYSGMALFFGLGFWISIGRFLRIRYRRKRTRYVLSNQQLIIIRGKQAKGLNLKTIDRISRKARADGSGIISLGPNYHLGPIAQVERVFSLLQEVKGIVA